MKHGDVAFCAIVNEEYTIGLAALLKSLQTSNPHIEVPFLVYSGAALPALARARIEREYPFIEYRTIDGGLYTRCPFTTYREWGMNPAFRYDLFRTQDYEQLIYLDADMLVLGNLDPLLAFRGALGACPMPLGEGMELKEERGFNAGMMSIGRGIRTPEVWQALMDMAQGQAWSGNQVVLNKVLKPFYDPLPECYNEGTVSMTFEKLSSARIIHFLGRRKPWESQEPFDPYQLKMAGLNVCREMYRIWLRYAPES